jgi:hypothetical protein
VGSLAAAAYLAEQTADMKLVSNRYDDLVLWGGFFSRQPARQRLIGGTIHLTLGIGLAAAYQASLPLLPAWPGWLRGVAFAQAENAVLYPGVPVLNALHPSVRSGRLPSLLTWRYYWVEIVRHVAYGVVLGALTPSAARRDKQ